MSLLNLRQSRGNRRRGRRVTHKLALAFLEPLESRTLLSSVNWTGAADGKSWAVAGNWSNDAVPTTSDDVTISLSGNPTIQISSGTQSVHSLTSSDLLSISGGSLSVATSSTLSGGLTMTGGSLIATGTGVTLSVAGTTTVSAADLEAQGGASLSLPALTSFTGGVNYGDTLQATGTGSVLSLPALTTLTENTNNDNSFLHILATSGGSVQLPALTQINGGAAGSSPGPIQFESDGAASQLNLGALTSFAEAGSLYYRSSLQATNGGTVADSTLTSLNGVNLILDGTGTIATAQIASYKAGTLSLSGGTLSLTGLTSANGSSFLVSGGASLSLPALTSFTGGVNYGDTLQATGTGSVLALPALTTLTENTNNDNSFLHILATSGGSVQLPALTQINGGAAGSSPGPIQFESDGAASQLNLGALTSFAEAGGLYYRSSLQATNGGTVADSTLTSLNGVNLILDGTGTIATAQIASYKAGTLSLSGGTLSLTGLTNANGSSFLVSGGASLSLPALTSFTGGVNYGDTLQATGAGSVLSLPALTTLTENTNNDNSFLHILATSGGSVQLPALTQINGGAAGSSPGPIQFESDGAASQLNLGALTSFAEAGGLYYRSSLQATNGGTVADSTLTSLNGVNLILDGTGTIATAQIASYKAGTLSLSGGTLSLTGLTNANGSSFLVSGGASLSLPALTSFTGGVNYGDTLQATGAGSVLSLPALTTLTENTNNDNSFLHILATSGGSVQLPALTQINGGAAGSSPGPIQFESDGAASQLNLGALTSFAEAGGLYYRSSLQATNDGTVADSTLTSLNGVNLILDGTGTIATAQIASYKAGTLSLSGGTLSLTGLTNANGSSFLVSGGASLSLPALTSFTGGVNYGDTLQATGAGSVLSLPALTTLTENTNNDNSFLHILATSGGSVQLPALTQINGGAAGSSPGPIQFESDGAASQLNLGALTSFAEAGGLYYRSSLQATNGGTVADSTLTSLNGVNLILDGTGTIATRRSPATRRARSRSAAGRCR